MSFADRDTLPSTVDAEKPVEGLTGAASEIKALLSDLSTEIEESRLRQGQALAEIEHRLQAIDSGKISGPSSSATPATDRTDEPSENEPWDSASAEALSGIYEAAYQDGEAAEAETKSWLQSRFAEISQHIARTLSDMRPQAAVHALGQKLDHFHAHIRDALDDVARRSDVGGLRLIESHVVELGLKLADVQAQLQRLDGIEANLRTVMDEVAGERFVRLTEHQDVLAEVIDSAAARTADRLHRHMAEANAIQAADAGRFEALRSMIEEALVQQRQAASDAADALSHAGLSASGAEADHINDLKSLVESSIAERRRGEQDALAMLDTVQQALVQVLDRIEALDAQRRSDVTEARQPSTHSSFTELAPQPAPPSLNAPLRKASVTAAQFAAEHQAKGGSEAHPELAISQAPFAESQSMDAADSASPVERMRREFIADAQRAKLRATASLLDGTSSKAGAGRGRRNAGPSHQADATSTNPIAAMRTKLFGVPPKFLAGALALIVAINGGLLFMAHKSSAPPIAVEILNESTSRAPAADHSHAATGAGSEAPQPLMNEERRSELDDRRSFAADDLDQNGEDTTTAQPREAPLDTPAIEGASAGVEQETAAPSSDIASSGAAPVPSGVMVQTPPGPVSDETLAAVYQQQVMAGLSGNLGAIAAQSSTDAMLPEKGGRIETAYTPADAIEAEPDDAKVSALDLPPATVGPLSLRLAAANGDASAQFEVAARLAEGKGTAQNFKEAVRWYQRSAAQGFAQAQYRIGTFYERGLNVPKDVRRARVWYQRAAEQGNVKAMHNLAVLTAGESNPDYRAATAWFTKAAEHGLADSQYNLAVLYENGLGVQQDRVAAYKWYTLAARGGDKDARERRDLVKATLSESELKSAEALVSGFMPKAADPLANDARAAGEDWKKRASSASGG